MGKHAFFVLWSFRNGAKLGIYLSNSFMFDKMITCFCHVFKFCHVKWHMHLCFVQQPKIKPTNIVFNAYLMFVNMLRLLLYHNLPMPLVFREYFFLHFLSFQICWHWNGLSLMGTCVGFKLICNWLAMNLILLLHAIGNELIAIDHFSRGIRFRLSFFLWFNRKTNWHHFTFYWDWSTNFRISIHNPYSHVTCRYLKNSQNKNL